MFRIGMVRTSAIASVVWEIPCSGLDVHMLSVVCPYAPTWFIYMLLLGLTIPMACPLDQIGLHICSSCVRPFKLSLAKSSTIGWLPICLRFWVVNITMEVKKIANIMQKRCYLSR